MMTTNSLLTVGVGGRGTLVCSIMQDSVAHGDLLCVDSDPALLTAELPSAADRLLLKAKRSPNRSIEYAQRMLTAERRGLEASIRSHLMSLPQDRPVLALLTSSPRGGISNAFTFEIARYLKELVGDRVSTMLLAVVPTYNRDHVDVISFNAGSYFRNLGAC